MRRRVIGTVVGFGCSTARMFSCVAGAVVVFIALSCSPQEVDRARDGETRDPRAQPLTIADALFSIPGITGTLQLVGDLDGDGRGDLVAECGDEWGSVQRIDAVSTRDGSTIRTLWHAPNPLLAARPSWDAGGDCDSDGVPDLLVGVPATDANGFSSGRVTLVSGADGRTLRDAHRASLVEHWGWKVLFLDDVDGDGCCEYAIGSPECDASVEGVLEEGDHPTASCCHVSTYSGRNGRRLWRIAGGLLGRAFGARLKRTYDADRDGHVDLLVGSDPRSTVPLLLVSGASGQVLRQLPDHGGPFGGFGDVDGDGEGDFVLDRMYEDDLQRAGGTSIVSSRGRLLFELAFPDWWSRYSRTIPLGDVDGDGVPDLMLGDANFNIRKPFSSSQGGVEPLDLRAMTLEDALGLASNPRSMSWESGTAWVISGRTKSVIAGVWGLPGSSDGMGLAGAPIPDLTGDGYPEIAICDSNGAHVFAGLGPDPVHEPK